MSFAEDAANVQEALEIASQCRVSLEASKQLLQEAEEKLERLKTSFFEKYPEFAPAPPPSPQWTKVDEQDDGAGPPPDMGPVEFTERN